MLVLPNQLTGFYMGATLAFSGLKEKLEKCMFTRDFLILERGIERDQSMSYPDFI